MTVRLLVQYGSLPRNSLFTGAAEAELLRTGQADSNVALGVAYVAPVAETWQTPVSLKKNGSGDHLVADRRDLVSGSGDPVRATAYSIETLSPVCGGANAPGSADTTYQAVYATRTAPMAARVAYYNQLTGATFNVDKTNIAASSVYSPGGLATPAGNATDAPVKFKWAGNDASGVVAVAPGAGLMTIGAFSDWLPLTPAAWAAAPYSPYTLWHIRSYISSAGYPFLFANQFSQYQGNKVGGLVRYGTNRSLDWIDVYVPPANVWDGFNDGIFLPMIVEFREYRQSMRVMIIGDSTANGSNSSGGGQLANYTERAVNLANAEQKTIQAGKLFSTVNMAIGGQTHTQIYARLPGLLSTYPTEIVVIPTFSPNSPPSTAAESAADFNRVLVGVDAIIKAGGVPIIYTSLPYPGGLTVNQDNLRKQNDARFVAFAAQTGTLLADFSPVVSGGGSPTTWLPGMTDDGLHETGAACAVMAPVLAAQLLLA